MKADATNLASVIEDSCYTAGIETRRQVIAGVTDSTNVMPATIRTWESLAFNNDDVRGNRDYKSAVLGDGICDIPCINHLIQLSINKGLKTEAVASDLAAYKSAVLKWNNSGILKRHLKNVQGSEERQLILENETRWHSTENMLSRFLEQRQNIITALKEASKEVSATVRKDFTKMLDISEDAARATRMSEVNES
eukprot:gb/GECG01000373.1/.p1 GENE.gb/GECG01000373.1/~~gb/GECG01000373.1/.p1  ORF type:complete len:195 (+),score=29.38 gb/GECG01000373.1/:1-585(+)